MKEAHPYERPATLSVRKTPRIAVIGGYMPFLETIMPPGFRAGRADFAAKLAGTLRSSDSHDNYGLLADVRCGEAVARRLSLNPPDAVLVIPTMASPAEFVWTALKGLGDTPVVIWNVEESSTIDAAFETVALSRRSSSVGTLMVSNILQRNGLTPVIISSALGDEEGRTRVDRALRTAVTARRFKSLRIGRIGRPLEGYTNVDLDDNRLRAALGCEVIDIDLRYWETLIAAVHDDEIDETIDSIATMARLALPRASSDLRAAARMSAAMMRLAHECALDTGAINCRGHFGVENPRIGSLSCLAVSYLTGRGVPFAGSGDLCTAVAMWIGKELSGGSLYCEFSTLDFARNLILCANTGESDFGWAGRDTGASVVSAGQLSGCHSLGSCTVQRLPAGRATMIGFSPNGLVPTGYVLTGAPGSIVDGPPIALATTAVWFKPDAGQVGRTLDRWATAGATHHASLSPDDLREDLAMAAQFIGCSHADVS